MQNQTLAITKSCIPYFKELRVLAGSVTATILMQQLDYWFSKTNGEAFYKFKAPCQNKHYKDGDSFVEELGFSIEEFTTAFSKIGIAYKSKTEFETESDKFKGMFYCSYFDRKEGLTFYYRNHKLLDTKLDELFTGNRQIQFTETDKANLQKPTKPVSSIYISEDYNNKLQQDIKKINKKEPDYILELSDRLKFILEAKINKKIVARDWQNEIRKLIEIDLSIRQDAINDVKKVIQAIDDNYGKDYFPVIESAKSLRKKFIKIEDYLVRNKRTMQPVNFIDKINNIAGSNVFLRLEEYSNEVLIFSNGKEMEIEKSKRDLIKKEFDINFSNKKMVLR